jgi:hypothetical protein
MSIGSLGSLEPDQQYPIVYAERINTRYGQSVLLNHLRYAKYLREVISTETVWRCGVR